VVDGRDLPPPEPMLRTLEALQELPRGEELTLLLFREPFPLYEVLERRGYAHRTELSPDGTYAIRIRHR
jgi:tRNA 2-thiouridine synthesizing protein A